MYTSGRNMVSPAPPVSQASNFGGVGGGGGAGGAGGAGGGHIDRRAHNLQLQMVVETTRLVDTLRSLERTLGTHILALSNILKPPRDFHGARDDRDQNAPGGARAMIHNTTVINEEEPGKDGDKSKENEEDASTTEQSAPTPAVEEPPEEIFGTVGHKKITATVSMVFLKIGMIEPSHDRFYAEVYVQAYWSEPAFDGHLQLDPTVIDWSAVWGPCLRFDNAMEDVTKTTWHTIIFNGAGKALVHERHRLEGTFRQQCDITEFPFDNQEISIVVATSLSEADIALVLDRKDWPRVLGQTSASKQEWNLAKTVVTTRKVTNDPYREHAFSHAALKFSVGISRKFRLYVVEYAFIVFLVSAAAFTSFGIEYTATGYRLMVGILVLLCLVTFQFAVSHERPSVAFITHLDEYVFAHVVITCLMCVWHAVLNVIPFGSYDVKNVDKIMAGGFGTVYILNEFSFLAVAIAAARANRPPRGKPATKQVEPAERGKRLSKQRNSSRQTFRSSGYVEGGGDHLSSHAAPTDVDKPLKNETSKENQKGP